MDWADAYEQVRTVLEDPEFRAGLLQRLKKERSLDPRFRRFFVEQQSTSDYEPCLADLLAVDDRILNQHQTLHSYITENAIARLAQPAVIAAGDLQPLMLQQLGGIDNEQGDVQWERFVEFAVLAIKETSYGREFSLGKWCPAGFDDVDAPYCSLPKPNDFTLHVDSDETWPWEYEVHAGVRGPGTQLALDALSASIGPVIQSLVLCLRSCITAAEMAASTDYFSEQHPGMDEFFGRLMPPSAYLATVRPCVAMALKCRYDASEFAARINNAIRLAECAEAHPMEAIAIALYVSAIEALLCEETEEKQYQLRTRIAAVLQFQGSRRAVDRLGGKIGDLYTIRSGAVHGSRLRATPAQLDAARLLSSAVLRGVLEWSVHCSGESRVPSDEEWVAELRKATDQRGSACVPGVTKELSEHIGRFAKSFQLDDN